MNWNKLPREIANAPSMEMFKVMLDEVLASLIQWKVSLALHLESDDIMLPSNPNYSVHCCLKPALCKVTELFLTDQTLVPFPSYIKNKSWRQVESQIVTI